GWTRIAVALVLVAASPEFAFEKRRRGENRRAGEKTNLGILDLRRQQHRGNISGRSDRRKRQAVIALSMVLRPGRDVPVRVRRHGDIPYTCSSAITRKTLRPPRR